MDNNEKPTFMMKLRRIFRPMNIYQNCKSTYLKIAPKGSTFYKITHGFLSIFLKRFHFFNIAYQEWIRKIDHYSEEQLKIVQRKIETMAERPQISVLMPVYNPPLGLLEKAIQSVIDQIYPDWELCIADDASTDPGVKVLIEEFIQKDPRIRAVFRTENGHISAASNSALAIVTNPYLALLDHDDVLHPHALYYVAQTILAHPDYEIIYSDEDKITKRGRRVDPYFKPDFNYELLLSHNMVSHLGVYRTNTVRKVGGFQVGLEGSQDYDLLLRIIEKTSFQQIRHIPLPLYHWRISKQSVAKNVNIKPYATDSGKNNFRVRCIRVFIAGNSEITALISVLKK